MGNLIVGRSLWSSPVGFCKASLCLLGKSHMGHNRASIDFSISSEVGRLGNSSPRSPKTIKNIVVVKTSSLSRGRLFWGLWKAPNKVSTICAPKRVRVQR